MPDTTDITIEPQLTYFFKPQVNFRYSIARLFDVDVIQLNMPYNNNSETVISLTKVANNALLPPVYYTLNSLYIAGSSTIPGETAPNLFKLMFQGYINDYTQNSMKQILIILPVFDSSYAALEPDSSITMLNNKYLTNLFSKINYLDKPNIIANSDIKSIELNNLIGPMNKAKCYSNVVDQRSKINYTVIEFDQSYLWLDKTTKLMIQNLEPLRIGYKLPLITPSGNKINSIDIRVVNNFKQIETTTATDIYIDCSPTNNKGTPVDIYTSKNLDQLKMFKINDLRIWAFRFITIFVILLIVYVVIKVFQLSKPARDTSSATPAATPTSK
uniref:Uncharacterized protein n=1 Tax=viral metagenome TaxID=1070528 RepID=A0A6C0D4Q9_9ZZZZ